MEFLFGPVPSRRLGLSLGINVVPYKTCTYNCVYCEAGRTTKLTVERRSFFSPDDIEKEFKEKISMMGKVDVVTFSGGGEPTLNKDIGRLIRFVKSFGYITVVLTNGSLLFMDDVREDLEKADIVIPSLDAATVRGFVNVNRPHGSLSLEKVIYGMAEFCNSFKGEVWLEVLFVRGMNDSREDLDALISAINKINPAKVQIGTVDRPPAEGWVKKLTDTQMMDKYVYLFDKLNSKVELIGDFSGKNDLFRDDVERAILKLINIRPCSEEDLIKIFAIDKENLYMVLDRLAKKGRLFKYNYMGKQFVAGTKSVAVDSG